MINYLIIVNSGLCPSFNVYQTICDLLSTVTVKFNFLLDLNEAFRGYEQSESIFDEHLPNMIMT